MTPVVIVYNLNPEISTPNKLFHLFSMYGQIARIKVMRDRPDTAMIQYNSPVFAALAHHFLSGFPLAGRELQVQFSKNLEIKAGGNPQGPGQPEDTKRSAEYSTRDNRYTDQDVDKYLRSACRPTACLFFANVHTDTTEHELRNLFGAYGPIKQFQWKNPEPGRPASSKMGMIEMETAQDGAIALMHLHNYRQSDNRTMKVAFRKTGF
eukprot:GDKI01042681.1.p1 GENE.GDKI01042681.1~~GDKI01042681.1.p1  ORF type:complete len:239 (-),score=43.79 GDKI01042681.1:162-785(-)